MSTSCLLIVFILFSACYSYTQELVTKEYQNLKFQQPYQQAMYYCSLILQDQTWPWSEGLEVLPHLEMENLVKFYPLMLSRTFLECYVAGSNSSCCFLTLVRFFSSLAILLSVPFHCCLYVGNLEPNEAESMIQHIEDVFFKGSNPLSQALFASQYMTNRIIKLERGINYFYSAKCLNPSDENSALVHYIQVWSKIVKNSGNFVN